MEESDVLVAKKQKKKYESIIRILIHLIKELKVIITYQQKSIIVSKLSHILIMLNCGLKKSVYSLRYAFD